MRIFIACSSSNNIPKQYLTESKDFLIQLFNKNHELIFGTSRNGILGLSYEIAKKYNCKITAVYTPKQISDLRQLACNEEIIADSVVQRTQQLISNSDIIIFLPGGIGTFYELISVIEMKRNGEINHPIIIYNLNNYFDYLFSCFKKIFLNNFSSDEIESYCYITNQAKDILDYINKLL